MRIPVAVLSAILFSFFYFWPYDPPVVVVMIDGFPPAYLDHYNPPNLTRLATSGVRSEARAVFPAKSIPSQYSMVTGLYPGHHGILANAMQFDDRMFSMNNPQEFENPLWWGGEPIWITAKRQGKKTFTYAWPGSETRGRQPDRHYPYPSSSSETQRIEKAIQWLNMPPLFRPDLILVTLDDVDLSGHYYGTQSKQVEIAIEENDILIGQIMEAAEIANANLIVLSDHGQVDLDVEHEIFLEDYINLEQVDIIEISPCLMVNTDEARMVFQALADAHPAMTVYAKPNFPAAWNWEYPGRTPDIVATLKSGWSIRPSREVPNPYVGGHGFDDSFESFDGIFLASGPAFQNSYRMTGFENIHLYELLAHLLEITPAPNDGTLEAVRPMLEAPPYFPQ